MYNSYVTSTYTIRCKGPPFSFSFNDYCTSCLNEKFYRNPLSYSSYQCCACCNCGRNVVQNTGGFIFPSYSNVLKKSTLIECAPHKRVILNGFDRLYGSRFLGYDVGRSCNSDVYEKKVCGRRWKSSKGKFGCKASEEEEERERQRLCGDIERFDEAETMISLLCEDVRDECFGVGKRREKAIRKIHVDEYKSFRRWKKRVNDNVMDTSSKFEHKTRREPREIRNVRREEKEKKVGPSVIGSGSKFEYESKRMRSSECNKSRKEDEKRIEDVMEVQTKRETRIATATGKNEENGDQLQKARKDISSCSSYYSISSGEFESDDEFQLEQQDLESKSILNRDDDKEEFKNQEEHSKESELVYSGASVGVESSWRKETEKKLIDTSVKEAESIKESSIEKLRYTTEHEENRSEIDFGSHSKLNHQTHRNEAETRMKHKHFKDTLQTFDADYENSSSSKKVYSKKDEILSKRTSSVQDVSNHQDLSKIEDSKVEEIRMKSLDDHSTRNYYNKKEKHEQFIHSNLQVESTVKHERLITDSSSESISISQEEVDRRSRKQVEKSNFIYNTSLESVKPQLQVNAKHVKSRIPRSTKPSQEITKISIGASSSQPEARGSLPVKSPPRGLVIEEITEEISTESIPPLGDQSLELAYNPQASTKKNEIDEIPLKLISQGDALGSADRLQKSSEHNVDEFLENVKNEIFSSEIRKMKKESDKATLVSHGSGVSKSKGNVSKRSSLRSRSKGPSDEMWHVNEASIETPSDQEALVHEDTDQTIVIKRSGKSLWNIISDIVHLRWARHEDHVISSKSGRKSSPNQSTRSETWFSGQDTEENNNSPVKKDTETSIEEVGITSKEGSSSFQAELKQSGHKFSTPSVSLPKDTAYMLSSSESTVSDTNPKVEEEEAQSSYPLTCSESAEQNSQPVSTGSSDNISHGKDKRETKLRKLIRNDQMVKDRFEEWEEAYRLESEQQKIDEMFMKEALIEAKKAADIWEMPVGAVLVQGGKIIARGYNLVEDLRDSTAHAEMMCIREASNILRSWRLSDTTLYVTLEPCAMCAGAILQARIDTLVWGAPNKLLGADGSWIRVLPNVEGASGSESTDKVGAPPVHPFHPRMVIRRGVLASECSDAMQRFFQRRRKNKEKKSEVGGQQPSCLPISQHPSKLLSRIHDAFHILFCL